MGSTWTYDYDFFSKEEVGNLENPESNKKEYGWIHKTAEEFADELMTSLDKKTMRKYIKQLVNLGFIDERRNPKDARDRTLQYRLNLNLIISTLALTGDKLDDYDQYHEIINNKLFKDQIVHTKRNIEPTRGISASSKEQYSTTLLESTPENTLDNNINVNETSVESEKSFKKIEMQFLGLSKRQRLTNRDISAINTLLKKKYSEQKIIELMEECFNIYPKTDKHKGITGFTFVKNYIENKKGVVKNDSRPIKNGTSIRDENEGTRGKWIQKTSISYDRGWVGDTRCDY